MFPGPQDRNCCFGRKNFGPTPAAGKSRINSLLRRDLNMAFLRCDVPQLKSHKVLGSFPPQHLVGESTYRGWLSALCPNSRGMIGLTTNPTHGLGI
jgi:hypothetical protein